MEPVVEEKVEKDESFYKDAAKYWSDVPATVDGVLGGFGHISRTDILGSRKFLKQLFKMNDPPGRENALDCGAGIGRITKHLLLDHFNSVDLVEQEPKFLEQAKEILGSSNKSGVYYNTGLQDFVPPVGRYDVIWCQWVLGHLTDKDLVQFFRNCAKGLKQNGVIIVKENLTSTGKVEVDDQDSSVTRPLELLHTLFKEASLHCFKEHRQTNFPKGLYPVKIFALRPGLAV